METELGVSQHERLQAETVADYLSLAKPKAMLLVVVTAMAGMCVASGGLPPLGLALATLVGGCLASAGANSLNCYLDRDIDALMARTAQRPLPAGRLAANRALVFGLGLTVAGTVVLHAFVHPLAALLALGANVFYVVGYTGYLKRRTPQNVVIGGVAGAAAPLIGYAAVAGHLEPVALALAALVFFWTPPHFWSLALLRVEEYRRAGVPMLPVARGEAATRRQITIYAGLAGVTALLPVVVGSLGLLYATAAVILGVGLVGFALALGRAPTSLWTRALFHYSVVYLGLIYLAMVVDLLIV